MLYILIHRTYASRFHCAFLPFKSREKTVATIKLLVNMYVFIAFIKALCISEKVVDIALNIAVINVYKALFDENFRPCYYYAIGFNLGAKQLAQVKTTQPYTIFSRLESQSFGLFSIA